MAEREEHSQLLQLPRELRGEIYTIVFESTRMSYGERSDLRSYRSNVARNGKHHMVPASHSLALLSVCKQIHAETCKMWMKHTLFNFHGAKSMLNKLSSLPHLIPNIRHLRLNGFPLLRFLDGFDSATHSDNSVFDLLNALHLDSLTIISSWADSAEYEAVKRLINHGVGWQDLFYVVPFSESLGFMVNGTYKTLGPENSDPQSHSESLLSEDDTQSTWHVRLYRSKEEQPVAAIFDAQRRESFDESPTEEYSRFYGYYQTFLASKLPLLIHVKRKRGVDVAQPPIGAAKAEDMQERFRNRVWNARRYNLFTYWGDEYDTEDIYSESDELASIPQVFDRYNDVNDI